jgi:NADPH2:quinone reductase
MSLRRRGLLCLFGNASGAVPPIDPFLCTKYGSVFITRPTLNDHVVGTEFQERSEELVKWIDEGKVRLRIDAVFALKDAAASHVYLEGRTAIGKILLAVGADQQDQVNK